MRRGKRKPLLLAVLVIVLAAAAVVAFFLFRHGAAESGQDSQSSAPEESASSGAEPETSQESGGTVPEQEEEEEIISIPQYDFIVCLDPGHGGNDSGCVSNEGREEAEDNLRLSLLTKGKLQLYGITVIMTRESDVYLELAERCQTANEGGADFFVSFHRNLLNTDPSVCGIEIWNEVNYTEQEDALGNNIMDALELAGIQKNRGVKHGSQTSEKENYYVNSVTKMPAVLLEMGFLSNEQDNALFDEKMDAYAQAIADGIVATWEQYGGESTGEKSYLASEVESVLAAAQTRKDAEAMQVEGNWPQDGRTNTGVNLRNGPGTEYDKVTTVGERSKVTVTGAVTNDAGEIWYQVTCTGINGTEYEGYCLAEFVDIG